jgi:hypothetical protein
VRFDLLRFRFLKDGGELLNVVFTDLASANAFFGSGETLQFGPLGNTLTLELKFELTSDDPGASYGVSALVVPEPQTWILVLLGVAIPVLARLRRRASDGQR